MGCLLCGGEEVKKIGLFLASNPQFGGTYQYNQGMIEAVKSLSKDKYECFFISYKFEINAEEFLNENIIEITVPFREKLLRKIFTLFDVTLPLWRKVSPYINSISKTFNKEKFDLIIFPSQDPFSYETNINSLTTIHDLMHRYEPNFPEVAGKRIYNLREKLYKNICKYSSGILVDSMVGKMHVEESYGVDKSKLFVLPFIAPKYIYNYKLNQSSIDSLLKFNLPPKYIFYPAQFWNHKNHINLVKAVNLVKEEISDIRLVLVGGKKEAYTGVVNLINELKLEKIVTMLGYVTNEELAGLFTKARALVMPTYFGPTNIPQLEAFKLECPVATSRIYGIPDQVKDAALLFDPHSVIEIADTIKKLWNDDDLCKSLVKKGKEISDSWGQEQFNKKLESIIEKIL